MPLSGHGWAPAPKPKSRVSTKSDGCKPVTASSKAIVTFGGGALRGAGDVRYVLGVITVTAWLVRIPVAVVLVIVFGMGAPGAWIGATTENIVRGGVIWQRFRAGNWKEKVV